MNGPLAWLVWEESIIGEPRNGTFRWSLFLQGMSTCLSFSSYFHHALLGFISYIIMTVCYIFKKGNKPNLQEVVLGCIKSYDAERRRIFCRITRSTQHIVQTLRTARKLRENRRSRRARRRAPPEPQHTSLPYTWSVRQP